MNDTTVDPNRTAGQRERVDLPIIGHRERVRILRARCGRGEPLPDSCDVSTHLWIAKRRHLLPDLRVFLAADLDLLRNRDDREGGRGWRGGNDERGKGDDTGNCPSRLSRLPRPSRPSSLSRLSRPALTLAASE